VNASELAAETPPRFSVIIPTYNREAKLPRAVSSVLGQSFVDLELIVVDDGSTDGTRRRIETLTDPRVRYLSQSHKGRTAARNLGAAAARGRWLAFLDSDDEVRTDWLQHFARASADPAVAAVCCGAHVLIDRPGGEHRESVQMPRDLGAVHHHRRGLFLCGTFAVRREIFLDAGGYRDDLEFSENTELVFRLMPQIDQLDGTIAVVDEPLLTFHNQRPMPGVAGAERRLHAARTILQHHGHRYRELDPEAYERYCSIAGVNAARLERWREARRHFRAGIAARPWAAHAYLRFLLATLPPFGRRFWRRYQEES